MDIKTLSEILGHKSPTVTMNRYAHSLMKHKTDMINTLVKLFQLKNTPIIIIDEKCENEQIM